MNIIIRLTLSILLLFITHLLIAIYYLSDSGLRDIGLVGFMIIGFVWFQSNLFDEQDLMGGI